MHEILTYPHDTLKKVSAEVTHFDAELRKFINQLEATMSQAPGCVGIAAPQVGKNIRLILVDVSAKPELENNGHLILINPEIVKWDGFVVGREGCLSVPDYTGNVIRAENIKLQAFDQFGTRQQFEMVGYEARVAQHEIDHLDGLLFLDRLVSRRSDLFRRKNYKKQ